MGVWFLLLGLTSWLAARMGFWQAALLVGAVVTVVGIVLLAIGKRQVAADKMKPNRTLESVRRLGGRRVADESETRIKRVDHETR